MVVPKEKYYKWKWLKTLSQETKGSILCGKKREGDKGVERAEAAEGAAWLQWRKIARKEHKKRKAEKNER